MSTGAQYSAQFSNRVREVRAERGWSQEELARRSGLSRAGVSSIEIGALCPSTAAALALAATLQCPVEQLFFLGARPPSEREWAWTPPAATGACRYWAADVNGRRLHYPIEPSIMATPHDGVYADGQFIDRHSDHASKKRLAEPASGKTLVIACCDPGVGVLADQLRPLGVRLLPLMRSSRAALELLAKGLVHAAGVHLAKLDSSGDGNVKIVRQALSRSVGEVSDRAGDWSLLRVARWEEGIALARGSGISSASSAVKAKLRWVGREEGSGARRCFDELLGEGEKHSSSGAASRMAILARDHRGVAEAVRAGWADAGVCLRLAAEECGVDFVSLCREQYDLCYTAVTDDDQPLIALKEAVRSRAYRTMLGDLPGYDTAETGQVIAIRL